jgi:hypothetical protein
LETEFEGDNYIFEIGYSVFCEINPLLVNLMKSLSCFNIIKLRREDFSPIGGKQDLDKNSFLKLRDKSLAYEPDGMCWLFTYHQVNQRGL